MAIDNGHPPESETSLRGVALLLAAAAVMAAVIAARSTMLSAAAGDAWQKTLHAELQRTAALAIGVRHVFGAEGDVALMIRQDESFAEGLRDAASEAAPGIAAALLEQAQTHDDAAGFLAPNAVDARTSSSTELLR